MLIISNVYGAKVKGIRCHAATSNKSQAKYSEKMESKLHFLFQGNYNVQI
jgi:hypothetical protein